jgi:hypothetical protein
VYQHLPLILQITTHLLGQSAPLTEAGDKLSPRYNKGSKQLDSNNNQLDVTASGYFLKEWGLVAVNCFACSVAVRICWIRSGPLTLLGARLAQSWTTNYSETADNTECTHSFDQVNCSETADNTHQPNACDIFSWQALNLQGTSAMAKWVRSSSDWLFVMVTVRHDGGEAELKMADANGVLQNIPLVLKAWKHLVWVGIVNGDTVLFREHYGDYRVGMQLARKLLLGTTVDLSLLQQHYGNILVAPVPTLPMTTIMLPILAVHNWTKLMVVMNSILAAGELPSLVQWALGNEVSILSHGNTLEITGLIDNPNGLLSLFSEKNKSKAGFLNRTWSKRGSKLDVSSSNLLWYEQAMKSLFEFSSSTGMRADWKNWQWRTMITATAVHVIYSNVRDNGITLGQTDAFLFKIRKLIKPF